MAEIHRLDDYTTIPCRTPSNLVKGAMQSHAEIFHCPSCDEKQAVPPHGKDAECENYKCGLQWRVTGASIKIWRRSDGKGKD